MQRQRLRAWSALALVVLGRPVLLAAEPVFLGKPASRWLIELRAPDPRVRQDAAFALGKIGGQTPDAVSGVLGSPAARLALEASAQSPEVVQALLRALQDPDHAGVREAAAYALGEMGPSIWPGDVMSRLIEALTGDADASVRRSAAHALAQNGPRAAAAREALLAGLQDRDAGVRQSAALALGALGTTDAGPTVAALAQLLTQDPDAEARREAARALGEIGRPMPPGGVAGLLERLVHDDNRVVRTAALTALVNTLGPADRHALPALLPLLRDPDAECRRSAALALGNIGGPASRPAVPILRLALKDEESGMRRLASAALANIGADAEEALPELIALLADRAQDAITRRNAALALTNLKEKSREAVAILVNTIQPDEHQEVLLYTIEALSEIAEWDKVALAEMGPAVPPLLRILRQREAPTYLRQRCVWLLRQFDPAQFHWRSAFEEVLSETDPRTALVRYDAAVQLGIQLGPAAPERTIDVLVEYLNDRRIKRYTGSEARVRSAGAEQTGGAAEVRGTGAGDARMNAVLALAHIGPKANREEVLKGLRDAQTSDDPEIRKAARLAVRLVQGEK